MCGRRQFSWVVTANISNSQYHTRTCLAPRRKAKRDLKLKSAVIQPRRRGREFYVLEFVKNRQIKSLQITRLDNHGIRYFSVSILKFGYHKPITEITVGNAVWKPRMGFQGEPDLPDELIIGWANRYSQLKAMWNRAAGSVHQNGPHAFYFTDYRLIKYLITR